MKTLIVLPARNEEQNIGSVLSRVRRVCPDADILVVNDASTDSTASIVRTYRGVSLINLPFWMGYGGALQTAYKYALQEEYDAVLQMDSDGQHDASYISDMIANLEAADVVVGSRFLDAQSPYRMPWFRRLGCRMLSLFARVLAGIRLTDPTSGFQALNRKALQFAVQDYYPVDYPDADVLMLMHRYRLKVIEIPVRMMPSGDGTTMHEGLQMWYYGIKMFLSMFVVLLRKS